MAGCLKDGITASHSVLVALVGCTRQATLPNDKSQVRFL